MTKETLYDLTTKYLNGTLMPVEREQLQEWYNRRTVDDRELSVISFDAEEDEALLEAQLLQRIRESIGLEEIKQPMRAVHRIHFLRTAWFRYAAAIMLIAGVTIYLWLTPERFPLRGNDKGMVEKNRIENSATNNKAILTLASGKKIELDNNNNKTPLLVKEGAVFDPREAGQKPGVASYNTITTPKGSQYQLILPDGTKIWLNAASSIKFPTTFTGPTRQVIITGEVFFEVSVNKTAPFFVSTKGMEVQVLGTSFNMNAYEDENSVKTSLVEGSIKVNNQLLTPGQAYANGKVITTNIDQDLAWKNGVFNFEGQRLATVLRELARWYDLDIIYENGVPDIVFVGEMQRSLSLYQALTVLKKMEVNFRLEGKRLIVMQ